MSLTSSNGNRPTCMEIAFGSREHKDSIELRRKILRLPIGLDFTEEELDMEQDQFHLAALIEDKVVGIMLFKSIDNSLTVLKMRQVAVSTDLQGKGIGSELLAFAEEWARKKGCQKIELHARKEALDFYKRHGYNLIGDMFIEVGIPHYKMYKNL